MAGKLVNVVDQNRLSLFGGRTTHSLPYFNAHASGFPLKWAKHQFVIPMQIKTRPIQIRQRMEYQRCEVCCIRSEVALAFEQAAKLLGEAPVKFVLCVR